MFTRRNSKFEELLEKQITRHTTWMLTLEPGSTEYYKALADLLRYEQMLPKKQTVSKDKLVEAGASLLGILLIIKHEHVNVIASKALGFVMKTR